MDESQRTGAYELLTDAVRKGGAAFSEEGTVSRENPTWLTFARTMAPPWRRRRSCWRRVGSESGPLSVLDIAAGHGLFGIAFATRNPQATVAGVDWKFVLEAAIENATAAGVVDRYRTIPGSAFEVDLGGPYDVALLPNFLHHFDEDTCVGLLKRLHDATRPGGTLAVLEFVPNEDSVSPPWDAMFALIMLASTGHGDAYTFDDLARMCGRAGFTNAELITLDPLPQRVVVHARKIARYNRATLHPRSCPPQMFVCSSLLAVILAVPASTRRRRRCCRTTTHPASRLEGHRLTLSLVARRADRLKARTFALMRFPRSARRPAAPAPGPLIQ